MCVQWLRDVEKVCYYRYSITAAFPETANTFFKRVYNSLVSLSTKLDFVPKLWPICTSFTLDESTPRYIDTETSFDGKMYPTLRYANTKKKNRVASPKPGKLVSVSYRCICPNISSLPVIFYLHLQLKHFRQLCLNPMKHFPYLLLAGINKTTGDMSWSKSFSLWNV